MAAIKSIYLYYHKEIPEPDTWEVKFSYYFSIVLNQITGLDIKIYSNLDVAQTQLQKIDFIDIQKTDAFVIIQNYSKNLLSKTEEIAGICDALKNIAPEKIFQVIKGGNAPNINNNISSEFPQYKFFELNHRSFKVIEFDPDIPGDSEKGFWEKLSDLVYDIKSVNTDFTERNIRENTIYLAEASDDQIKNREKIKRELLLLGYRVLPTSPLPRKMEDFENAVTSHLYESILSINILGEMYGDTPQMADYSYVEIQNRVFDKESAAQKKMPIEPKTYRILWSPPKTDFTDDKQSQYIKRIQKESLSAKHTEFVQSTISDLIEIIEKKIKQIKSEGYEFINEEHKTNVCILYDNLNNEQLGIINSKFTKEKILYYPIHLNSSPKRTLNEWLQEFRFKDNFIIINTEKGNSWVSSLLALIIRSKGLTGALPILSLVVLTSNTERDYKYLMPVEIETILYKPFQLEDQINVILSKLKL